MSLHGFLRPPVIIYNEGIVVRAVNEGFDKGFFVFRFRVPGGQVVFVGIVDNLKARERREGIEWLPPI